MKIKRLVLQGYKTFATKTEFLFDEGLTAVVGPNGSGKSNIADAIRWVLGEQSYSTLRGKRTVDMIFAGSQSRARAGMAQAILTLDNSDGWLPIDYTEVEIGRRAYRSGENEYILNGQRVRLKDVTELLASSGLAERTYTIIGQGLVDKALSLKADERRALFEEAAGITHYKNRRAETLRRLADTQHNLERVHDILNEIQPRLRSLKRQATRARNFEQVSVDLREHLRLWYGFKWEQAKANVRHAREVAEVAEKVWQDGRHKLLVQQTNADDLRRQVNRWRGRVEEAQTKRDELREQLSQARREAAVLSERRDAVQRQLAEVAQDLPQLQELQTAAQAELNAALEELQVAQAELQTRQGTWQQFNATYEAQQAEIGRWQQTVTQLTQRRQETQTRLAQAQGQVSQLQERLGEREEAEEKGSEGDEELVMLEQRVGELTAVFQSAQQKLDDLQGQRAAVQKQRSALLRELKPLRKQVGKLEGQVNQQRRALARLEARAEMLDQMRGGETGQITVPVVGQLARFLTIPDEYQTAVSAALGEKLAMLLVEDEAQLWQLVRAAEGGLTAVALDRVQSVSLPELTGKTAVIGRASELVQVEAQARAVVDLLLGNVWLVENAQAAYGLAAQLAAGGTAVALDGFVAHAGGLVQTDGRSAQNNILAREQAWREAQAEVKSQQKAVKAAEKGLAAQQKGIQTQQTEVDDLQAQEQQLGRDLNDALAAMSAAQRQMDRAQQQQDFVVRQRENQAKDVARLRGRVTDLQAAIGKHEAQLVTMATEYEGAQAQLAALPVAEGQQQRQTLRQDVATAQTIVAGRQAVVDSRRATLNQLDNQWQRWQQRQAALQKQQATLAESEVTADSNRLSDELTQLEMDLSPMVAHLAEARQGLQKLEEETAVHQRHLHDLETRHTQTQIKLSQQENQLEGLQERIKADLGLVDLAYDEDQTGPTPLPMGEVVEQLPQVDELPEDIENTIHQYRGQMQRMGAINPDAPQEFEETQTRYEFLQQQVEDLTQTDAQLREIVAELDELTSKAFKETVEQVNLVFGDTFTQLFGGGSAQLVLTDPDDLTVSGVDILARLPNRREQGLGLLSGGERSLTAVALIFSLLKVSPTPFCVMDEVDAALDEANINRFRELLRELSLKTQFIVITHNRGTVQAAQTLYGVSMGSDSASQVISMKPEEYIKQAALL